MTLRLLIILLGLLFVAAIASLLTGYVPIAPGALFNALFSGSGTDTTAIIAHEIRLPRMLLSVIVGGALGLCGAALQGLLRNPLAEPGLLGVSASAGLGAVIVLYLGLARAVPFALPAAAIFGAVLSTGLLFALSRRMGTLGVLLSGVAINALALASTSLAMSLSTNPYALSEIVYWLMGSLKDKSMSDVALVTPFAAIGALLIASRASGLDALALGEDSARSLGVSITSLRLRIIGGIALAVGACVAVSGAIGFVGLVVPHLLRPFVGHRPSALLGVSAVGGALLLTLADLFVRVMPVSPELMLGVVTAFVGAPFFLYVMMRKGAERP